MQNTLDSTRISKNYAATAATVVSVIENLQFGGPYSIKMAGEISSHTICEIEEALNKNKGAQVFLDFSETTGLVLIKDNTFCDCENITSITLPNSVIEIGDNFFSNSSLTNINFSNGVENIGESLFSYCKNLKSITLPSSVSEIDSKVFAGCSNLLSISVEDGNTTFSASGDGRMLLSHDGKTLISYPSASGNVIIPDSVTAIGKFAFLRCSNLTNVTLHDGVIEINAESFSNCSKLTSFTIGNNNPMFSVSSDGKMLLSKDGKTLRAYPSATGEVIIPSSVTKIERCAFHCCEITSVTIPDSVTEIYGWAFEDCSSLQKITIPNNTEISSNTFEGCINLTSFSIQHDNPRYSISADNKMILSKDGKTLIACPAASGEVIIPNSVTKIEDLAFGSCSNLTSVILPNSVTKIGFGAFSFCENLRSVTISEKTTFIYNLQFLECCNLTSFIVDSDNPVYSSSNDGKILLSKDKKNIFAYPSATGNVIIPSSVTKIDLIAFCDCEDIASVTFSDTNSWFYTENKNCIDGTPIDVTDPIKNATMLQRFYWYKG